jgi:hypothetical protein
MLITLLPLAIRLLPFDLAETIINQHHIQEKPEKLHHESCNLFYYLVVLILAMSSIPFLTAEIQLLMW